MCFPCLCLPLETLRKNKMHDQSYSRTFILPILLGPKYISTVPPRQTPLCLHACLQHLPRYPSGTCVINVQSQNMPAAPKACPNTVGPNLFLQWDEWAVLGLSAGWIWLMVLIRHLGQVWWGPIGPHGGGREAAWT